MPRIIAVPLVVLAAGAILGAFGWTVFVQLVEVTDALPAYTSNIHEKMQDFQQSQTTSLARAQQELGVLSEHVSHLSSELTKNRVPAGEVALMLLLPGGSAGKSSLVNQTLLRRNCIRAY